VIGDVVSLADVLAAPRRTSFAEDAPSKEGNMPTVG
jgi:hypothetical protein